MTNPCPSPDQLVAFHLGHATVDVQEAVCTHLESCPRCEATLQQMDTMTDSLLSVLRQPGHDHAPLAVPVNVANAATAPPAIQATHHTGPSLPRDSGAPITGEREALPYIVGYELLETLGKGGMGVVYKARQLSLNRIVALKTILPTALAEGSALTRFCQEAEAVAQLQHPNLVQIYEINLACHPPYLTLEYVDGGNLKDQLDGTPQPPRPVAALVETLARAIHTAHQQQIIHRDLKPANILLAAIGDRQSAAGHTNPDGPAVRPMAGSRWPMAAKITDFGLAKHLDEDMRLTRTGVIAGTPCYMAPELTANDRGPIGPATDIYSLGVILYEMLCGRVPLEGATAVDTLLLVRDEEPVPLRQLLPRLSRDLETICMKCLAKPPRKRYASALDLADDLRRYLDGKPIAARPTPAWERTWKLARRHPREAALLLAIVLITILGFVGMSWQMGEVVAERDRSQGHAKDALKARDDANQEKKAAVSAQKDAETAKQQALTARDVAETNVYFSRVSQARLEWDLEHDMKAARLLLDKCRLDGQADRRGWEWHYLLGLTRADLFTLQGHAEGYIDRIAYSPDGRLLAVAGGGNPFHGTQGAASIRPGTVILWEAATGKRLQALHGHTNLIFALAFSPDGKVLATSDADHAVILWDVASAQRLRSWSAPPRAGIFTLAFSPDGRTLASANADQTITYWDPATGTAQRVLKGHNAPVYQVAFSPDGKHLASCGNGATAPGELLLWDASAGLPLRRLDTSNTLHYSNVAFSPDGRLLASVNHAVKVWDVATGQLLHSLSSHRGEALAVAFRPDGQQLATAGSDRTVRLWDPRTGAETGILRGHTTLVRCLAYHPTGRLLASGDNERIVKVWDVTRPPEYTRAHPGNQYMSEAIAFDATDRNVLAAYPNGMLYVRDAATGVLQQEYSFDLSRAWKAPADMADFDTTGRRLAGVSQGDPRVVKVWEAATGRVLQVFSATQFSVHRVTFSRDGRRLATLGQGLSTLGMMREVRVWDVASGQSVIAFLTPGVAKLLHGAVALSPDGSQLAFDECSVAREAAPGGSPAVTVRIKVCDLGQGEKGLAAARWTLTGHTSLIKSLSFSPNGTYLATADQQHVQVWNTGTGKSLHARPLLGHVYKLAFSPDEKRLAAVNREEVHLWDVASGEEVLILRGAPPRPGDNGFNPKIVWSHDGQRLAASNWEGSVSVWDMADRGSADVRTALLRQAEERGLAWHLEAALSAVDQPQSPAFTFHWKHVQDAPLPGGPLSLSRGLVFARLGQWSQAAADFDAALERRPTTSLEDWFRTACLRLLADDSEAARKRCQEALKRFAPADGAARAGAILTALVVKDVVADAAPYVEVAVQPQDPSQQYVLALAYYRAGRLKEAAEVLAKPAGAGEPWKMSGLSTVLAALVHHAQGKTDAARQQLTQAEQWLEQQTQGKPGRLLRINVTEGLTFLVLLREARAVVGKEGG